MSGLVLFEVVVVIAAALVPLPVPRVLPVFVAASLSRWFRGRPWGEVWHGPPVRAAIGAAAGVGALVLALLVATPLIENAGGRGVEWSMFPIVRGNGSQLFAIALLVAALAAASELALRGWIVERVLELARPGPMANALAVATGALAEAMLVDGDFAARLGGAAFGAGLGALYVAAGRSVVPGLCARIAFALGALVLEAARWIG